MGLNVEKMLEGICKPVPLDKNVEKNDESNSSLLTVDEFVQKWNEKKVSEYYKKSSEPNESKVLSEDEMRKIILEYNDACSLVDKFVQDYNKANRVGLYKDNKDDSKTKEESITAFGVTREEFEKIYQENNGFDVKEPENNIKPVSDNFSDFITSASEGYSKTLIEQDQSQEEKICDTFDIINEVMGLPPMSAEEKNEELEKIKQHSRMLTELQEETQRWQEFKKPYIDAAIAQAKEDYEKQNQSGISRTRNKCQGDNTDNK